MAPRSKSHETADDQRKGGSSNKTASRRLTRKNPPPRNNLDVHSDKPSFLQRLTGLRLGFCKDFVHPASSTDESTEKQPKQQQETHKTVTQQPEQKASLNEHLRKSQMDLQQQQETQNTVAQQLPVEREQEARVSNQMRQTQMEQQQDESKHETSKQSTVEKLERLEQSEQQELIDTAATVPLVAQDALELQKDATETLLLQPQSQSLPTIMTRQVSARPPTLGARQVSLQRPPLASSPSTASAMRVKSFAGSNANMNVAAAMTMNHPSHSMPPPLRNRLESNATASSKHRARAHESFNFSVDSLHMILNESAPNSMALRTLSNSWSSHGSDPMQQHQTSAPMTFVGLENCQLMRDCSALAVDLDDDYNDKEAYSFDYSDSENGDDHEHQGDINSEKHAEPAAVGSGMGTSVSAAADGASLVSSTSPVSLPPQEREYSPTSVVKINEEVPSWMLAWTGQQSGKGMEPVLVETEKTSETIKTNSAIVLKEKKGRVSSWTSAETVPLDPSYLVPGLHGKTDANVVLSAWMAASVSNKLATNHEVSYDDVIHIVVYEDGMMHGIQYDGHVLFRVDLRGKAVKGQHLSNSLGRAVIVKDVDERGDWSSDDANDDAEPLCTLLPISLPPRVFLNSECMLVDEARFQKYRYALVAPFESVDSLEEVERHEAGDGDGEAGLADRDDYCADKVDESGAYCGGKDPVQFFKSYAPSEQQDASIHLQFLLDAQCRRPFELTGQ
ncbi:hypothetical protein MPSEU_000081800 [Mayamaea pseudoterrestris]|nr:hypothetical protein MPSEU_000081800 [Mayamaea pseudoterrestris]